MNTHKTFARLEEFIAIHATVMSVVYSLGKFQAANQYDFVDIFGARKSTGGVRGVAR